MITDAELLQRYVNERSEPAFAELVRRHVGLVYSAALRQLAGDAHLAQEVAQTVFTALARKADSLTSRPTLAGWLYLSTHHAAAQAVRSGQRRRVREQEARAMHEILADNDGAAANDWDRVRPVLDNAMRALSEADREAVLLRYFERRPFDEIGAALNMTADAARMRVERALEKLRVLLGRGGITSTSAALAAALSQQALVATPAGLAAAVTGTALAGAGVAAGAGFFMSTPILVTGAIALAAIGATVYQTRQLQQVEQQAVALTRERDGVQAKLRDAERRAAQIAQQNATMKRDLDGLFANKGGASGGPAKSMAVAPTPATEERWAFTAVAPSKEGTLTLRDTPADPAEAKREIRAVNGAATDSTYAALYRQMGWTKAQSDQFRELMLDVNERRDVQFRATTVAARAQNPNLGRAEMQPLFEESVAQSRVDAEATVRGAFGEAAAQGLRRYQETLVGRSTATQLATSLFYSDSPLTPAQADRLTEIIAANARTPDGKTSLGALDSEAMFAQAQTMLTPTQLAALRQIDARRKLERERITEAGTTGGSLTVTPKRNDAP